MSLKKQTSCLRYCRWSTSNNASRCVFIKKQTRYLVC